MELNDSIEWRICHSVQPQALGLWWKQQPRSLYMLFDSARGPWKYAALVRTISSLPRYAARAADSTPVSACAIAAD